LQLLEDMQLIGYNETDGKKLYHITNEGLTYLRERGRKDTERPKNRWEHHGRHGKHGGHGKHELRGLMKEWSDVIYLMASAAGAAQENPSSKQAAQFQELMVKFQDSLKEVLASVQKSNMDETVTPQSDTDSLTDDDQVIE
jgi:DNA-binding PadR family transcriptional regulator